MFGGVIPNLKISLVIIINCALVVKVKQIVALYALFLWVELGWLAEENGKDVICESWP
jgi:hypothetical protein